MCRDSRCCSDLPQDLSLVRRSGTRPSCQHLGATCYSPAVVYSRLESSSVRKTVQSHRRDLSKPDAMMYLLVAVTVSLFSTATSQAAGGIAPDTRQMLLAVLKNMMSNAGAANFKPDIKQPPMPMNPSSPFLPPPLPMVPPGPPGPPRTPTANDGLFMDLPNSGAAGYGPGAGYGAAAGYGGGAAYGGGPYMGPPVMRSYHYCPPGPTTADHCKDQKLQEALYYPDGTPRYNWVPPRNPWDTSMPDTVKETARNILMMKVNGRGGTPTPKEWELMSLLGDPKEMGPPGRNPFAGR